MISFWLIIALLSLAAMGFIAYPLIRYRGQCTGIDKLVLVTIVIAVPVIAIVLYLKWGQSNQLSLWYGQQRQAAKLRQELGSPEQVITRLQQHLKEDPTSVQGWYLLGKLYFSQQQFKNAAEAYAQLNRLQPNNPDFLVQYAQALYFANHHQMSPQINRLLRQALNTDPENTLAINLLAIDAYRNAQYADAIQYWQKLLNQYPPNSDDYQSIATAIENAQLALQRQSFGNKEQKLAFNVEVKLADALQQKMVGNETVFVYARDAEGSPMPLAIVRFKANELPKKLTLSEDMAMNPAKTLADAKQVIIIARISKSGQAMPDKGDLVGKSEIFTVTKIKRTLIQITINEMIN